jgi:hypothetical protein
MEIQGFSVEYETDAFDGILARLNQLCSKNPCEANLLKIYPSDEICGNVVNLAVPRWRHHWFSFYPNPYIVFDFCGRIVSISSYSIKTYSGGSGCGHLRSWVVEGKCADRDDIIVIDEESDCPQLNGSGAQANFGCRKSERIGWIRLRLTGPNHAGSDFLVLRGIEFFGTFE